MPLDPIMGCESIGMGTTKLWARMWRGHIGIDRDCTRAIWGLYGGYIVGCRKKGRSNR